MFMPPVRKVYTNWHWLRKWVGVFKDSNTMLWNSKKLPKGKVFQKSKNCFGNLCLITLLCMVRMWQDRCSIRTYPGTYKRYKQSWIKVSLVKTFLEYRTHTFMLDNGNPCLAGTRRTTTFTALIICTRVRPSFGTPLIWRIRTSLSNSYTKNCQKAIIDVQNSFVTKQR